MTALEGVKVLDFSRVLAGPLATMTLGDLGADVIKVERPGSGDDTRAWGPPFKGDDAAYFLSLNRNKRSVVLDLATDQGRAAAVRLAGDCDVVVENFRPGLMDSWGLGYDALSRAHPHLVYCSVTAFGSDPASSQPGYDIIMQGVTGLMSITGQGPGAPTKTGVAILDVVAGLQATIGVLAALAARGRTGRGQKVEVTLFEAGVAALVNQAATTSSGTWSRGRWAMPTPTSSPTRPSRRPTGPSSWRRATTGCSDGRVKPSGAPSLPPIRAGPPTATGCATGPSSPKLSKSTSAPGTQTRG